MFHVNVVTRIGPAGELEPVQINFDGRHVAVATVIDRWFGHGYRYFKLSGNDGATYILRYDEQRQYWEVVLFRRPETSGSDAVRTGGSGR